MSYRLRFGIQDGVLRRGSGSDSGSGAFPFPSDGPPSRTKGTEKRELDFEAGSGGDDTGFPPEVTYVGSKSSRKGDWEFGQRKSLFF